MADISDKTDDEYEEYDEFDEEYDERGLSGFSVLVIGIIMIGAFVSVVFIAYQQGMKAGGGGFGQETPYVAADPEPMKIETAENNDGAAGDDREVYDAYDGEAEDPVTILTEGPEEPVARDSEDPIGAIVAEAGDDVDEPARAAFENRLANLREEDALAFEEEETSQEDGALTVPPPPTRQATLAKATGSDALDPLSGSHVVQVGAFRSDAEAQTQWKRLETKLGNYLDGKAPDVERADLGDRGVYHRLRIGPFKTSDDASDYCSGLKERGQDCLIKKI